MIDFPITDLLDDAASTQWLEQHLHPNGRHCPHCGSANGRLFRPQAHFDAYRCRGCDGYYPILTGTVFAKTQQAPSTLVLLVRGTAKGEPTARLARELGLSRQTVHTLRQRVQDNVNETVPLEPLTGTAFEADELYMMIDYKTNSCVRVRHDCEFQEFRPSKSKPIIDEIDRVLAQHYGVTPEELDFIINYDIKYRMGRDSGDTD